MPFGRAPSAGERKERGARKKEREGDGSADVRGQGRSEREKEQRMRCGRRPSGPLAGRCAELAARAREAGRGEAGPRAGVRWKGAE